MTICAADLTFGNLGENSLPAVARHHVAYVAMLFSLNVIEFQYHRIRFAAINAAFSS
jgi:hypothetical protein